MIQKTFSMTTTDVTKEQIWELLSNINDWKAWDTTIDYAQLQGDFVAGSIFFLKPKGGPKVRVKLIEVQPVHYFKDVTTFPLAKMYDEHWYEETPQGLKITSILTMKGLLATLWYQLVMKDIVEGLESAIKAQIAAAKQL